MKKSAYLHYLKEFQAKGALQASKTFKNVKKPPKMNHSKTLKPQNKDQKLISNDCGISDPKRFENKQNQHPNITCENEMTFEPKQKARKGKQFELSLTRCNFEPTHQSRNLFLIEGYNNDELIVCQKCSMKFTKRVPLNSFSRKPKYTYAQMIYRLEQLEKDNKKLKRIKLIQKENFIQTLQKTQAYYNHLIHAIYEIQDELECEIKQVYNQNESMLDAIIEENSSKIDRMNKAIERVEKQCLLKPSQQNVHTIEQNIDFIFQSPKNKPIELSCINLQIKMDSLQSFIHDFKSSKYFIEFSNSAPKQNDQANSVNQSEEIQQPESVSGSESDEKTKTSQKNLSPDFQKQIPFNIEYSATEEKPVNFSHKMQDELSKMSSSEQLLIDSLRNHQSFPKLEVNSLNYMNEKHEVNFKTQSSTHRTCTLKEENSYNKQNFVKHLHIDETEVADLICDEDLTLSSSHSIHTQQQQNLLPRKSLRLSYNPIKSNQGPLTISQLTSHSNQTQKMAYILNPSLISTNENKHEISFELDENMIIDANILPSDEMEQENFDIISPAFKII